MQIERGIRIEVEQLPGAAYLATSDVTAGACGPWAHRGRDPGNRVRCRPQADRGAPGARGPILCGGPPSARFAIPRYPAVRKRSETWLGKSFLRSISTSQEAER
jgi:hypothetical protein